MQSKKIEVWAKIKSHKFSVEIAAPTPERVGFILLCLLDELNTKTEWEQKFIKDITQKFIDKVGLSTNQYYKLEQIWKKTDTY